MLFYLTFLLLVFIDNCSLERFIFSKSIEYVCMYIYIYMVVCMYYICIYVCMCVYVCMYVCTYAYV